MCIRDSARLTPEYLQLEAVRALSNNTKVYWGDSLPALYANGAGLVQTPGTDPGQHHQL